MNHGTSLIRVVDRGSYAQVVIAPGKLPAWAYADLVVHIRAAPVKPLLVIWETSPEDLDFLQAFNMGMALAGVAARIAIVFGRGYINETDRFTELVARNRGAQVRTCDDVPSAKAWLGVD